MTEIFAKPISALVPHKENARVHPAAQMDVLFRIYQAHGWVSPIVLWPGGNDERGQMLPADTILKGHGWIQMATRAGLTTAERCVYYTGNKPTAYMLADNKSDDLAEDDNARLAQLLASLDNAEIPLAATGFSDEEFNALLDSIAPSKTLTGDGEEAPDIDTVEHRVKRGDIWLCGASRMMCGDSTNADDVTRLMDGKKIHVAVTSPPYASQRKYDESSGFKSIHPNEYAAWFNAIQQNIAAHLADDGSFFLNIKEHCDDGQRHLYVKKLLLTFVEDWHWRFVDEFCWRDKRNGVPGCWNNRFKDAWEPIFHFTRQPKIKFRPEAVSTASGRVFDYSADNAKSHSGSGLLGAERETGFHTGMARPSNVIEAATETTQGEHSAPYPLALPCFFIAAFSDANDCVYDPFMGSGTTLIAAARLKRLCFGMEISENFCDVILARWEAETTQTAVLLSRATE